MVAIVPLITGVANILLGVYLISKAFRKEESFEVARPDHHDLEFDSITKDKEESASLDQHEMPKSAHDIELPPVSEPKHRVKKEHK